MHKRFLLDQKHITMLLYSGRIWCNTGKCIVILLVYCITTLHKKQIFKGPLQIMVKGVLPHATVER